jgi:hypothetical protein
MSNVFNGNLSFLEKHQPNVYNKLNSYLNGSCKSHNNQVERILLASDEDIIFNMLVISNNNEYLVCDHENPINQAYNWIEKYIDPSNKADIVFGLGFGYHLEVLLTSFKDRKVIIIEPNIELFHQIMRVRNLETIIKKAEIIVDEPVESILQKAKTLFWDTKEGGIQCEPFEVYADIFGELWDELRGKFIKLAQNFNVDIATRRHFGDLWVHNNIRNLSKITEASNASGLVGKFRGIPAILVSAGPSLEKNVHLLNGLKNKCIIMAAGTAVNILEKHGIEPDFMVGIDAGENEAKIHRKVESKDIYFIYSNQVATGSVESYEGPKFLMDYSTDLYTDTFFRKSQIDSTIFMSGPSVSNTCFDIMFRMGCNPIILIGQDLAYTDKKMYAGENSEQIFEDEAELLRKGYCIDKDIFGKEVITNSAFLSMRNWFEGYFENIKEKVEIINSTEGGLEIENARNEKFESAIQKYITADLGVSVLITQIYEQGRFNKDIQSKLAEYKTFIVNEMEKLENYTRDHAKIIDLIKRDIYHPMKNKKAFERAVTQLNNLMDLVMESPIYNSLLKNMIELDFYLIKAAVDRDTSGLDSYNDAKRIYVEAMEKQNEFLKSKLRKLKEFTGEN